jgi:adenosylmethionine-8-amino-7-oxononanoate aminotransferase
LTSGGSESVETAIKLARHYFVESGRPTKSLVIGRWRGYHGNTLGALSASGHVLRRREYEPYLLPFPHIDPPYRYRCTLCAAASSCTLACADELEQAILNYGPDQVAAFIAEPVVGAAAFGMLPTEGYFERIRAICDRYDVLLIVDEVLCGMGRTGRNFAIDHFGVVPDIIACGKGISSGYTPLGAVLVSSEIHAAVHDGSGAFEHGFTYGGNPLSAAVGLAVLQYITKHDLVHRAAQMGQYLIDQLRDALVGNPIVGDVEGLGMLVGIELVADRDTKMPFARSAHAAARFAGLCRDRGVLITPCFSGNAAGVLGDRVGVAPPFVFERTHVDETVAAVTDAATELHRGLSPS